MLCLLIYFFSNMYFNLNVLIIITFLAFYKRKQHLGANMSYNLRLISRKMSNKTINFCKKKDVVVSCFWLKIKFLRSETSHNNPNQPGTTQNKRCRLVLTKIAMYIHENQRCSKKSCQKWPKVNARHGQRPKRRIPNNFAIDETHQGPLQRLVTKFQKIQKFDIFQCENRLFNELGKIQKFIQVPKLWFTQSLI